MKELRYDLTYEPVVPPTELKPPTLRTGSQIDWENLSTDPDFVGQHAITHSVRYELLGQ